MNRFLVSICSLIFLLGLGSVAVAVDDDKSVTDKRDTQGRTADEETRRKATREAIQRAVLGEQVRPKTVQEKTFQRIHHEQIGEYVGSWVKLETYYGRKVEGTLKRVSGNIIFIDEHIAQGSASYPIDKRKISGLKVLK